METFFFRDGMRLLQTVIVGVLAYASVVIVLRVTGKRTLSKMNAFDLVITVALGSTLASVITSKDISLAQGVTALALLAVLQLVLTWLSVRVGWVRKVVTGEPSLLSYRGEVLPEALKRTRVTVDELRSAVRGAGLASVQEAEAVVLETDGSFSVVKQGGRERPPSLEGVRLPPRIGA